MIVISKAEILKVNQQKVQSAVEESYRLMLTGNFNMPDRMHVSDHQNMLLLMPCFSQQYFATKLVSVFPDAPECGAPAVNGIVVLNDNKTGQPLALLEGASLTAQRTGAVGGLAVSRLTGKDVQTAGILGAGVQGHQQARYLLFNRKIKTLFIYDPIKGAAETMARKIAAEFDFVNCRICDKAAKAVEKSKIIIAATTSRTPIFEASPGMVKGKTFVSIGSFQPDMQEFPDIVGETADQIYVDTLFAMKESGDLAGPLSRNCFSQDKVTEFAQLLENQAQEEKTYLFKSVGMALFDLSVAKTIYEMVKIQKTGQWIEI